MFAAAVTVAISVNSGLRFASYSPEGSVALDTAAGLASALAAYVAFGRLPTDRNAGASGYVASPQAGTDLVDAARAALRCAASSF